MKPGEIAIFKNAVLANCKVLNAAILLDTGIGELIGGAGIVDIEVVEKKLRNRILLFARA